MLTLTETGIIDKNRYYEIIRITQDYIEFQSKITGHCWIIQGVTFDNHKKRVRLYHKHKAVVYKKKITGTTSQKLFSITSGDYFSLEGYRDSILYYVKGLDPGAFCQYSMKTKKHSQLAYNVTSTTQKEQYFYLEPYCGDGGYGNSELRVYDSVRNKEVMLTKHWCLYYGYKIIGNYVYYLEYPDTGKSYHNLPVTVTVKRCKLNGSEQTILVSRLEFKSVVSITSKEITYRDKYDRVCVKKW